MINISIKIEKIDFENVVFFAPDSIYFKISLFFKRKMSRMSNDSCGQYFENALSYLSEVIDLLRRPKFATLSS